MADTQRTLDAFTNATTGLFKDNVTNDMTCQRVRDFAVSVSPSYGSCYVSTMLETNVSADDTYYKLGVTAGATTAGSLFRFTHSSPGRLTYTGAPTISVDIQVALTWAPEGNAASNGGFALFRNGSQISGAAVRDLSAQYWMQLGTRPYGNAVALAAQVELATNDYVEVYCKHITPDAAGAAAPKVYYVPEGTMTVRGYII